MNLIRQDFELFELIPEETLLELLSHFSEALGVKTMLEDYHGRPILWPGCHQESSPSIFCPFCQQIRKNPEAARECQACDSMAGMYAYHAQNYLIYRCHMGIVEAAIPLVVDDRFLGSILIGEMRVDREDEEKLPVIYKGKPEICAWAESDSLISEYRSRLQDSLIYVPLDKLRACVTLMTTLANQIAQICVSARAQQQIEKLKLQLLEKNREKIELQNSYNQLQLQTIHSNMDPKFLLNALTTINSFVLLNKPQQASDVIASISTLIRHSLRNREPVSTIGEEWKTVEDYLALTKLRNPHYRIRTKIDSACFPVIIPHFAILPIIQESIRRSIASEDHPAAVCVEIQRREDNVEIRILDDGPAREPVLSEELNRLRKDPNALVSSDSETLINIIRIWHSFYGNTFRWDCSFDSDRNNSICFSIPYSTDREVFQ